jgi:23S rRNA pseudouridine2457 synthase
MSNTSEDISDKKHQHFMLYKPFGYLSQFMSNSKDERKKRFLGELYNFPDNLMAIGRLDEKSEGLLLLTTDGKLSSHITSHGIEKEYCAQVNGEITDEAIKKMQQGVEIGFKGQKYITKPCVVTKLANKPGFPERIKKIRADRHGPTSWISVTLTEGKFRQVRKMTSAVGYPTLRLVRVRIGKLLLGKLKIGEVKELSLDFFKNY